MAARVARAEMVLGVVKGYTAKVFARKLCPFSARGGHLAVLKWARAHGYPWDEMTCARAAENGHLEVLQ